MGDNPAHERQQADASRIRLAARSLGVSLRLLRQLALLFLFVLRSVLFLPLVLVLLAFVSHEAPPVPIDAQQWPGCLVGSPVGIQLIVSQHDCEQGIVGRESARVVDVPELLERVHQDVSGLTRQDQYDATPECKRLMNGLPGSPVTPVW